VIKVITAGFYSSIQDGGRFGYRDKGVPVSGVMDSYSANLANILLNNSNTAAVIEMTYQGMTLQFEQKTYIAITGAQCDCLLDDELIKRNVVIEIPAHSVLKIGRFTSAARVYLAVMGGFSCPLILNSRSYYQGVTEQAILSKGDVLLINKMTKPIVNRARIKSDPNHFYTKHIIVSKGPEFELLPEQTKTALLTQKFNISSQSNRMAYRLNHDNDNILAQEIITSSVQPGTVQLTPSGALIVLMRDCQTTGGYARVLQLTEQSINQLAQKTATDSIVFRLY
jgi:biotin-dependent carboxylase-like uncharacterized protein